MIEADKISMSEATKQSCTVWKGKTNHLCAFCLQGGLDLIPGFANQMWNLQSMKKLHHVCHYYFCGFWLALTEELESMR